MPKIDYVDNSVTLRKYWDYCQDVHYKKLVSIKTNSDKLIDNDPPDTFNRIKKKAIQEENRKIVTRLWGATASKPFKDKFPQYKIKSMVKDKMKQDQQKIDIENARLAKKLNQMPSTLDHKQLRLDFEKNMKYKSLRAHPKAHTAKKAPPLKLPYLESKRAFSNSTAKSSSHSDMKATDKMSINLSQPPEEVEQHLEETQTEFYPETSFSANTKSQTKYNSPPVVMTTQPLLEQRLPEKIDHEIMEVYKLTTEEEAIDHELNDREKAISNLKLSIGSFTFPSIQNFEEQIQNDYWSSIPENERSQISRFQHKKYTDSSYEGDLIGDKRHGLGRMTYDSGRSYFGEWRSDLRHGRGVENYANGNKYIGYFVNGKAEGFGIYKWINGEVYEGEWKNGVKEGKGAWKNSTGDQYIGHWKDSKAHGWGKHIWSNGDFYEGDWVACIKHGVGIERYSETGDEYRGEFRDGKPHGYGHYNYTNGTVYKGYFKEGKKHGKGRLRMVQGHYYIGEFKNDLKEGRGCFTWASGNNYKGEFKNDKRHGKGMMVWSDGSCYKGDWYEGIQHGWGAMTFTDGKDSKIGRFDKNKFVE